MAQPGRNIEVKFTCANLAAVRNRVGALGAEAIGVLYQHDTFFAAPHARLKLRDFGDGSGAVISYRRPDIPEARGSDYQLCPVTQPARLAETLAYALGTTGVVKKRRHLFLYRHTRIHLDEVEGLGTFVELETVVADQSEREADTELRQVAAALEIDAENRVPLPYVELLASRKRA